MKVVLITGGSKGIGLGCVLAFQEANYQVVFCARDARLGESIANSFLQTEHNPRPVFLKCDVSSEAQIRDMIRSVFDRFGRIDCLICNAGWHPPPGKIDDFRTSDMEDLMKTNFFSVFWCCKYSLPHLRKTRGNIINMSSWVGAYGQSSAVTYLATKGAITSFSKGLAIDEAKNGVRVNIVSPGNIMTPLWKEWADGEKDPEKALLDGDRVQVLQRKGTIKEVGDLCVCIAQRLTFTTGVDHFISGGAELGYGIK